MNQTKLIRGICFLVFAFTSANPLYADTYYVATNGQDENPGSETQPWRSIQHAADRVNPGDTVRIRAGDYYVGHGLFFRRAGTAPAPIVFIAHGDGAVRITNSTIVTGPWKKVRDGIYSASVTKKTACAFDGDEPLTPPGPHGFQGDTIEQMIPGSFLVKDQTLNVRLANGGYCGEIVAWADGGHKIYNNVFLGGGGRLGTRARPESKQPHRWRDGGEE